jgi:hypothetical protein
MRETRGVSDLWEEDFGMTAFSVTSRWKLAGTQSGIYALM